MVNGSVYLAPCSKHPKKCPETDRRTKKVAHQQTGVLRSYSAPNVLLSVDFPAASTTPRVNSHPVTPLQRMTGKTPGMIPCLVNPITHQVPLNTPVYVRLDRLPALLTAISNTPTAPKTTQPNKFRPILTISGGTLFYANVIRQQMFRNAATSAKKFKKKQVRPAIEKSSSSMTPYYTFMADASLLGAFFANIYVICTLVRTRSESVC